MRIDNVQVFMGDGEFRSGSVEFEEKIQKVCVKETAGADTGPYLIPGLIDIHTHGVGGGDHSEGSASKMQDIAKFYAGNGVTSFLATTTTASEEVLSAAMKNIASYERAPDGARCVGINMEGPFLSYGKRGAQLPELLKAPDIDMFDRLYRISGGNIKLVCLAPELEGGMEFIRHASQVSKVSLAHTECDYETAMRAFDNGADHVTHLFNGMNPLSHRAPSLVGAAFDANAYVEVICDGIHIHPSVIRAIFRMFPRRVCLISDSSFCTGLPDGEYTSGAKKVKIKNGVAMLPDESSIAGSTISLMKGVRIAVSMGIPLAKAVAAATIHSAESIGMSGEIGSVSPGANADFVLLDSDLQILKVYIEGKEI